MAVGAAITIAGLNLAMIAPAQADIAPNANDIVGVGSDTVQNIANFLADGDAFGSANGVNIGAAKNRVFSFDATPDANDRAGYAEGSTSSATKPLNPTIVLRAGSVPVLRPNGSGSGLAALLADTALPHKINFVRMSSLPSPADLINPAAGATGLHVVKISTDNLKVAAATGTHAPAALSAVQLVAIYKCSVTTWNDPLIGGASANTIIPLLPQAGSGTRKSFLADLQAANGNVVVPLGGCIQTVEENDPMAITGAMTQVVAPAVPVAAPLDAIAPFSEGRNNLYVSGYFHEPSAPFPGLAAPLTSGISMLGGYSTSRNLYIVFRDADKNSTVKWQPGSTLNFVQALFLNPTATPYVASGDGQAAILSGGATPLYGDCLAGAAVTAC
jgi:ABC-type phosphate transport system substrate-binding protein